MRALHFALPLVALACARGSLDHSGDPVASATSSPSAGSSSPAAALRASDSAPSLPASAPVAMDASMPPEQVDLPAPGPGWVRAAPPPAFGYVSFFFGGKREVQDRGSLRPLGRWEHGEHGCVNAYRRVDPMTHEPVLVGPIIGGAAPEAKALPGGALWYDLPSDGVQFLYLTSGSLVLEAEDRLANGHALATVFRPWALKAAAALATPRQVR